MRRILWICILAAQLAGQTVTTITGRFVSATGAAQTGSCTFTPTGSFAVNGPYYVTGPAAKCMIAGGSLAGGSGAGSCTLIPTDGVLAQRYWMECRIDQPIPGRPVVPSVSQGRVLVQVPTSATPLDIATLVVSYAPPPSIMVQWSQFAQGNAQVGQAPIWSGSAWLPGYVSGTATWGAITGTLGNQTDLASALSGKQATISGAPGTWPSFGAAALLSVGTAAGTVAAGNDSRFGSGGGTWGSITGTLSSQTDLNSALGGKQATISGAPGTWPSFSAVATSGNYGDLSSRPTLGTAAAHATTDFQAPITGAPSTWPTTNYAFSFSATTYNTGTVDVTNGSNAIVGHGTTWTSGMTGMLFIPRLANCNQGYKITYEDATDGTLESTYGTGSDGGHPCPTALGTEYQLSDIVAVPASTHQLGTADITIQCFDANTPRNRLDGFAFAAGPSVDPTTYAVQIVFWSAQAGRCILQR